MKKQFVNKDLVLMDLFSGIGGFHLGLSDAGFNFKQVYYSEIDKHAIANYKYNFKDATYIGDVKNVIQQEIDRPNIITFGSPCQDFSVAGRRHGLDGEQSSLIEYALEAISHFRPDIFIWENVKGAFSSNNREDFWAIIQAFADIRGYSIEWQLLNTAWILPQNRERIYLIGYRTEAFRSWRGILPIGKNDKIFDPSIIGSSRLHSQISGTITTGYGSRPTDTYLIIKDSILRTTCNCVQAVLTPGRLKKRQNGRRMKEVNEPSFTLTAQDQHGIFDGKRIRKFTEIECERLQGYPDDWTRYGEFDNEIKEIARTRRYSLCGNAVSKVMPEAIGRKILMNLKQ